MSSIVLNKPAGGQLTLSPEDGTTSETVEIPSVGVGKVLQFKEGSLAAQHYINTSSWSAVTNGVITLTPVSSTSKFIIQACAHAYTSTAGTGGWAGFNLRVLRNNTIDLGGYLGTDPYMDAILNPSINEAMHRPVISLIDTPNTTSQITYNLQGMSKNSRTCLVNRFSHGFIQVTEVAQ